ncbi:MAG: hypothetical protein HYW26_01955 [Candidatus Aenigmarchaeota archaeon]|nr:hypothetical protein [Candidatus Aenigmarchaeota archaeon]
MKTRFIDKKWLVVILVAALIEPLHYFLLINYPPPGKTFMAYDSDEALVMGIMRSPEYGFDNPWSPGEKVFFNGALASPYAYIPLGYLRMLLGIDALLMNIIAKFVLFIIFLAVLFKTMEALMPRNHELAFVFFLLPLGLMTFGYAVYIFTGIERFAEGFSFEFSILSNISRVYYYLPLITGLVSLLLFSKGRKTEAALALGATFFFYPFFGFAFAGLLLLYSISGKNGSISEKAKKSFDEAWKPCLIASAFLVPWLYARFSHPEYFTLYSQNSLWWRAHLVGIAGSYFFLLLIIFLANTELLKKHWKIAGIAGVLSTILMVSELKSLSVPPFNSINLPTLAVDVTEIMLLSLFAVAWFVLESNMDRRHKFTLLFALAFFPLSIFNPKYAFWQQYRMGYILHIPLAMLAALYFDSFAAKAKSYNISRNAIFIFLGILAVTSFLAYNYRFQMADRIIGQTYFDKADKDAMIFLEKQPKGIVMASDDTNYFLPVWSGHYALYHPAESQYQGGGPGRAEKKEVIAEIYSGKATSQGAAEFISKNNVGFVFRRSGENINFDSYPYLEKIYDNGARIYRVNKAMLTSSL